MGRSHQPGQPRRRRPLWEPEPLHIPLDRPGRGPLPGTVLDIADEEDDAGVDDRSGTHVIVIDLA
jgi:hypothetical protein